MSDEPSAPLDTGTPAPEAAPASTPVADSKPPETQREIMARVFDSAQEREARKNGEVKPPPQPRGPNGQFAGKTSDAQPAAPTPNADQPPAAALDAPKSWSTEAKALWASLSPDVQKHVAAREAEFERTLGDHTEKLKGFDNLGRVLDPWREGLTKGYGGVEQGLQSLLSQANMAFSDWPRFVVENTRARNISPEQLMQAFGAIPVPDPQVAALSRQNQELTQRLESIERTREEAITSDAQRAIAEFKSRPENKHFDKLAPRIGGLLKAGLAQDLADAYAQAAKIDPEVAALIAKEQADAAKAKAEAEARERAKNARNANVVNIRTGAPAQGAAPKMSQRDLMAATYDRLHGSGAAS